MQIRKLPVGQGLAWFKQAIDLGGRNPRAVFGAAVLLILALYTAAMLMALIMVLERWLRPTFHELFAPPAPVSPAPEAIFSIAPICPARLAPIHAPPPDPGC